MNIPRRQSGHVVVLKAVQVSKRAVCVVWAFAIRDFTKAKLAEVSNNPPYIR